jgi:hypothetical protein
LEKVSQVVRSAKERGFHLRELELELETEKDNEEED